MDNKLFAFFDKVWNYIDNGKFYREPFRWLYAVSKHSNKCTFYTLRFGCSFAAVNTIKPQLL